jgi:glyoxylase-like metal-dependent hydrolase (beta-lactamase superfamily II)
VRRVRFTTTGWMESPGYMLGLPHRRKVPIPAVVAVCERDDGTILLVDAGWSAESCSNPRRIGLLQRRSLGVRVRPGDDVASQLRRVGLDPSRVTTIVATHLHLDHVGGAGDFPNAELVATHDEVTEAYRASWLQGYRKEDIERVQRLRLVRMGPAPRLGFSHAYELDDEVTLLDTRGHSAGHTAVLLRDGETSWIHGGDVAYLHRELREPILSPLSRMMAHDPRAARVAQRRLRACLRENSSVRLVLSHDAGGFEKLPRLDES